MAGPTAPLIGFYERYARVLFESFAGRVKYWLTFNEINSVLHFPFMSGGIPGNPSTQELYQAVHHELVASARVVRCGHEIDPDNKIGCMILAARATH